MSDWNRLNTEEENRELQDARERITSGEYSHIYQWVFACGHLRFETGKCGECTRRYLILGRHNKQLSLEKAAKMLTDFGYEVRKPSAKPSPPDWQTKPTLCESGCGHEVVAGAQYCGGGSYCICFIRR